MTRTLALRWECSYPWLLGVGAAGVCAYTVWNRPFQGSLQQVFASTVDLGAIAVGFLAATKAVLLGMQGSKVAERMRVSGLWDILMGYLLSSIRVMLLLVGVSLLFVLLDSIWQRPPDATRLVTDWRRFGLPVWTGLVVAGGAATVRVLRIVFVVLRPTNPNDLTPPT